MAASGGHLLAMEPGPTLKALMGQAPTGRDRPGLDSPATAVQSHMKMHAGPQWGAQRHVLVMSWFQGNGGTVLRYTLAENGYLDDARDVFNHAVQGWHQKHLSHYEQRQLRDALTKLPASRAEPPIERTVYISFQDGGAWRSETYDADALPAEMEKVMALVGERYETKERRKKK